MLLGVLPRVHSRALVLLLSFYTDSTLESTPGSTPESTPVSESTLNWEVLKGVGVDGAGGNLPFFCTFLRFSSPFWRESPLFLRFSSLFCALS